MGIRSEFSEVLVTELRFLTFRSVRPDWERLRWHFLALSFASSWLVGVGRYWDAPDAPWWQQAGLGSLAYLLFMSAFLWVLAMPLQPRNWTYFNVLTFVGMTAPPGLIYAVPVERFLAPESAFVANQYFLLLVALWRVALLWFFLRRSGRLAVVPAMFALAFPLVMIMAFLAVRELQSSAFDGMSGNRTRHEMKQPDIGRLVVEHMGLWSIVLLPVTFFGYAITAVVIRAENNEMAKQRKHPSGEPGLPDPSPGDDEAP